MADEKMIPLSVPNLKGNELIYVKLAVETEWVSTAGPYVSQFEQNIAEYAGVPSAVACQSGTAGLHIALQLCGVGRQDLVIVPTLTFIAAVNPVRYLGADPVFMDCDDSLCMETLKLAEFCRYTESEFWAIVDKFYNRDIFEKSSIGEWVLKHPVGEK